MKCKYIKPTRDMVIQGPGGTTLGARKDDLLEWSADVTTDRPVDQECSYWSTDSDITQSVSFYDIEIHARVRCFYAITRGGVKRWLKIRKRLRDKHKREGTENELQELRSAD